MTGGDEYTRLVLVGVSPKSAALLATGLEGGALARGDDERAYWRAVRRRHVEPSPAAVADHLAAERVRQRAQRARNGPRRPRPSET